MARLLVRLHGQEVTNLQLEEGQEYIAGRAPDVAIRLSEERGISRHHLKFYEREGQWICESLSKFVLIQLGKKSVEVLELTEAVTFSLPPYEFHFEPAAKPEEKSAEEAPAEAAKNLPAFYQPRITHPEAEAPQPENTDSTGSPKANNEATIAGRQTLVPYVRVSYPNTADDEVLKLEGQLWTAGREPDCEIFVDSPHVSRRHFEISRSQQGYFLTDLGSSNGTKVNGSRLTAHEPTKIESGDEIQVMSIRMHFEIRDTQFNNKLDSIPVNTFDPMLAAPVHWHPPAENMLLPAPYAGAPMDSGQVPGLRDWRQLRPHHIKKVDWKKNKVRILLALLLPVVLYGLFTPAKKEEPKTDPASANSVSFDKLKAEQKNVVKDSFHLARNLYVQGKYALCLTELAKVHEVIPQFDNSKELQSFCEQGLELVRRQEDLDRKERERALIEQQISGFVEACKQKLTSTATVEETRQCLAEAIVLAPEHNLVIEMLHTAQMHEEEVKFNSEQRQKEQDRAQKGFTHFNRATEIYKKGKLAAAIVEYEKYLNTEYPRNSDKKEEARRQLASIKAELKTKVSALFDECKSLGGKNKYKDAYKACKKAIDEDPGLKEAKEYNEKMLKELRREMKAIYEDSVLEESLGNVDTAKEKWRKILAEDLEFDEYAVKAKSKLQKYGSGE